MIDLGKWFDGLYQISESLPPDEENHIDTFPDETGFGQN